MLSDLIILLEANKKRTYAVEGPAASQGMAWFGCASFHWIKVSLREPSHISATLDQILPKEKISKSSLSPLK